MKSRNTWVLSGILLFAATIFIGCNRGAMRLYGTGSSFPPAVTGFSAKSTHPQKVYIEEPADKTADHYGQSIAGTSWQGTRTDTLDREAMPRLVYRELSREISQAALFSGVAAEKEESDLVLETEVRAFGAQVRGFIFARIGGVAAFKFTLKRDGQVLFEKVYEKVVRDNDDEYTGSSIGMIENAMRSTMSDSFREVLKAFFKDLQQAQI